MLVYLSPLKSEKFVSPPEELFGGQASDPHMVPAANGYPPRMGKTAPTTERPATSLLMASEATTGP
jgi:hypothetical protein